MEELVPHAIEPPLRLVEADGAIAGAVALGEAEPQQFADRILEIEVQGALLFAAKPRLDAVVEIAPRDRAAGG